MGPFIKSNNKTSKIMTNLLIALLPIIIFSFYKNGIIPYQKGYISKLEMFYPLLFILLGSLSSLLIEEIYLYVFSKKRDKELIDAVLNSYAIFPGLFISLVLPINTPLSILFIASLVAIVIGKMLFGGFGNNIFNPALVGCIFVITCFGVTLSSYGGYLNKYEVNTISSATPLTNVSQDVIGSYDTLVKPYGSLWDFFIGFIPGAVGETSSLLCIIAFIYLSLTKTIKWRIPSFYVITVFIMTYIIGLFNNLGIWYPLFQVLSGGLLFGSVFMATDPVTSPVNKESQVLYGICLGILTVLLRYLTNYPEGVMTSILFMNMFVFILDRFSIKARFKPIKYYISLLLVILIGISLAYYISTTYKVDDSKKDVDYEIIDKQIDNNKTIYEVSQKGFGGKIKASITFEDNKIISIKILEHNESSDRYELLLNNNYLDKLIEGQEKIEDVDTVSGATISSGALKKMLINTLADFKGDSPDIEEKEDNDPIINSISTSFDATIYNVSVNSFNGILNLDYTMISNEIKTIKPITYNDTCISSKASSSYYKCPIYLEDSYLNELVRRQDNLDEVETVSGATISSRALLEATKKVKEGTR